MSAVATAAATTAAVNSAIAAQQAHEAKVAACNAMMPGFKHEGATVAQIHVYVDCAETVYPSSHPLSPEGVIELKIMVILLLIAAAYGAKKGYQQEENILDAFMYAIFASVIAAVIISLVLGAVYVLFL